MDYNSGGRLLSCFRRGNRHDIMFKSAGFLRNSGSLLRCSRFIGSAYGIYGAAAAPNIQNCRLNAYEFTVDGIFTSTPSYHRNPALPTICRLISISAKDSERYFSDENLTTKVLLYFGGNTVKLMNRESFSALRNGIGVGDKIRCAVLEYGKYCCISIF